MSQGEEYELNFLYYKQIIELELKKLLNQRERREKSHRDAQ